MYCTIIETCPKCGFDLIEEVIATYPPIYVKKCYNADGVTRKEAK